MTVPQAIEIRDELEQLDELIKQLEEARETAQIGIVDMEALESMVEEGQADDLKDRVLRQFVLGDVAQDAGKLVGQ